MLGPAILAFFAMIGLSVFLLQHLITTFIEQPPMSWIVAWGAFWLAKLLAVLGGWVVILAATYLVAMLLSAIIILPLLLDHLSETDYPDLARMGSDSVVEGAWNSTWSAVLFIVGWLLTLPLWMIPGLGLILPFFWMAWLNRRTFTFDALAVHATEQEWRELRRQKATPLLGLGLVMALLAYVPFVGLLAPSLAALAYVHYCLEALRGLRQGAVVTVAE
jgi:uncharacterized protein involved in cysteine biosynthesis